MDGRAAGSTDGCGHSVRPEQGRVFSLDREEDRLVWIFGSSRSGSTWLLRMLSELDGAVPIDDPHLGHHLGVWRPIPLAWAAADADPELTILNEIKREKPSYFFSDRYRDVWGPALRQLIVSRFDAQVRDAAVPEGSDPLVVVKEPGSHIADLLMSLFEGSRMIFLLRDGRDVVDSWLAAHREGAWAVDEGAFAVAPEGREAVIRWQASVWDYRTGVVLGAYRNHDPSRRILVRYEDLLADPAGELERICRRFEIEVPAERLREVAAAHEYDSVPRDEKGAGKAIRSADPGGWRDHLSAAERQAMYEVMGERLAEVGYLPGFGTERVA
jgi:Sulfotransferase family